MTEWPVDVKLFEDDITFVEQLGHALVTDLIRSY